MPVPNRCCVAIFARSHRLPKAEDLQSICLSNQCRQYQFHAGCNRETTRQPKHPRQQSGREKRRVFTWRSRLQSRQRSNSSQPRLSQGPRKAQPGSVGPAVSVTKSFVLRLSPGPGPSRALTRRQGRRNQSRLDRVSYLAPRSFLEIFHAFHAGTALVQLIKWRTLPRRREVESPR